MEEMNPFESPGRRAAFGDLLWRIVPTEDAARSVVALVEAYRKCAALLAEGPFNEVDQVTLLGTLGDWLFTSVERFTLSAE